MDLMEHIMTLAYFIIQHHFSYFILWFLVWLPLVENHLIGNIKQFIYCLIMLNYYNYVPTLNGRRMVQSIWLWVIFILKWNWMQRHWEYFLCFDCLPLWSFTNCWNYLMLICFILFFFLVLVDFRWLLTFT